MFGVTSAAVLVATGVFAYAAAAGDGGGRTIKLHERALAFSYIPAPRSSPVGDRMTLSADILDEDGNVVGRDAGDCAITNSDGTGVCNVGLKLPDGQLTVNGPDNVFAITGGTGAYRNARGQAHVVDTSPSTSDITITLIGG